LKNAFVIVTLAALLSACASAPRAPAPEAAAAPQPELAAPPSDETAGDVVPTASAPDEPLPNVALSSELLYKIMKAEMEFRGGQWQGPYITMMGLAQLTRDPRLARRAAEMALSAKQGGESMAAIRLWRELAPNSEEAAQYYLGFVILSDNLAEAEAIFKRRLEQATPATRGLAMFQIQQFLARAKDKPAAASMLERLLAPYADTAEAHVVLAQTAYTRGDPELALKEAQAALAIKPGSEIAVLTLAQVTEDDAKVSEVLARFLAANPGAREVRAARARVLVNQKQYDQARDEFLALLKGQPDNLGTLYALGIMSMQLGEPVKAEGYFSHFMDVLADHPDDERDPAKVLMILSQLAEERGDPKAALAWIDKIEPADPKAYFGAQLRRGLLLGKQGDLDGARAFLASLKPEDGADQAMVVLTQGQLLRDAGKVEEAYALMEEGVKRYPANPDLLYDFALLAEKTNRLDVMEKSLREVMVQAPDNHHAYNALGYSLAERNVRLPEAFELIDKAMKMAPGDPFIMDSMGWVQYRLGKLNEAEALLRKAYSLRNDPEIAVHLGEVLWHKGQKADAQKLWREARAKDPKNDTLKNTLARLHLSL
jgi:tetratricopeptide (TPR) repeat protein